MSKIMDKIKKLSHTAVDFFREDSEDDLENIDPKLEEAMKPAVDRINALEARRAKEQKSLADRLKNDEGRDISGSNSTSSIRKVQSRGSSHIKEQKEQSSVDRGDR